MGDIQELEHLYRPRALAGPIRAREERPQALAPDRHEHVLQRREPREDSSQLKCPADPELIDSVGSKPVDGLRLEADRALVAGDEAGDHVEDGGLARAVGSDQPSDAAGLDGDRALVHRDDAAESLRQVVDPQQAHGFNAFAGAGAVGPVRDLHRTSRSVTDGTMPRGSNRITSRNTAA